VCDDAFDNMAASVACVELGFERDGLAHNRIGQGSHPIDKIWLDDVQCRGTEDSIRECQHRSWGTNNCSTMDNVGVTCYGEPISVPRCGIRLVNIDTGVITAGRGQHNVAEPNCPVCPGG